MIVIDKRWNTLLQAHEITYLANTAADVDVSELDQNCAAGSAILVIATESVWIKNTEGKWQKSGTTEVL